MTLITNVPESSEETHVHSSAPLVGETRSLWTRPVVLVMTKTHIITLHSVEPWLGITPPRVGLGLKVFHKHLMRDLHPPQRLFAGKCG